MSHGEFHDRIPNWSFRHLLLEHADGLILDAESPETADVLVYSCVGRSGNAGTIAKKANAGTRLIVYGLPGDPEIAALLPVDLSPLPQKGFPERRKLAAAVKNHPLLRETVLTDAAPAVHFRAKAKKGSAVLLSFTDGTPFLTERGSVLHIGSGIGNRLDASDSVFYDKFLLHAIALSSDSVSAELDKRDRAVRNEQLRMERKRVLAAAGEAGLSAKEAASWRLGLSGGSMGRFGWLIGEPLLVESVGKDLSVASETQQYSFASDGVASVPFRNWTRKVLEGNIRFASENHADADPCELWSGIGVVEYETSLKMDPEWKGKIPCIGDKRLSE